MADITDQILSSSFAVFLARATASQKQQLQRFLDSQPSYSPPASLLPVEEQDARLELIEQLRETWSRFLGRDEPVYFSYIELSTLLLVPINTLQNLRQDAMALARIMKPQQCVSLLMQGKISVGAGSQKTSHTSASIAKSIHRNANERDKCYWRDRQTCILTKAAHPDACHIVPYAVTANDTNIASFITSPLINQLEGSEGQLGKIIVQESLGSLDKSWNMVCLHPTLHRWWSKHLFGLKCLGLVPNGDGKSTRVQIQFYWMPRNGIKPNDPAKPPYDKAMDEMLQTVATERDRGIVKDVQRDSFHELETGQTFEIVVDNVDAIKMKAALDLQWAVIRLAAMSGAAGVLGLGGNLDGDGDGGGVEMIGRVTDWLEETPFPEPESP
ncbi:hypothetical protein V8C35DRAFT_141055 [Trichoderma chlorosporum]